MATTHLIGLLYEVKPTEVTDYKTKAVTYGTEIIVQFDGLDEEGYRKRTTETISLDEEYYEKLVDNIDKYVAIAYVSKVSQYGTTFRPDRSMPVLVLDKNPLDYSAYKKEHVRRKVNEVNKSEVKKH